MPASVSASPSVNFKTVIVDPLLRLGLRFLSVFKSALLQNFNNMVEREPLIVEVQ
jgi:hypothetical protein